MFHCFNTDCNLWGEPQGTYRNRGLLLIKHVAWYVNRCNGCGGTTVVHDNWTRNERTHDDGTPVTE